MIHFQEIKNDYMNKHGYMEYEGKYGEWEYVIVLDSTDLDAGLLLQFQNDESIATFAIDVALFIGMSKVEFHNFVNAGIYYHAIPKF